MLTTILRRSAAGLAILAAAILAFAPAASAGGTGKAHAAAKHTAAKHTAAKHHSGKHRSKPAARATAAQPAARACPGEARFRCGPLYFSGTYLGDDPDPNIRFQIWRDLGARFGGED